MTSQSFWEMLIGRTTGPLTLRLILQPTMATLLAIRAGLADAKAGRPPYFWSVLKNPDQRRELLKNGWKSVGKLSVMAIVLDCIYQVIELKWIYPLQAVIVAIVLAIVPYVIVRGLVTRIAGGAKRS